MTDLSPLRVATVKPSNNWAQWPGYCPVFPEAGYHASTGRKQEYCPNCGLRLKTE